MKKIILELLNKYFHFIVDNWISKIDVNFGSKLSKSEIESFVNTSLKSLVQIFETSNYLLIDQYLLDTYNVFTKAKLNLLDVSQIFSFGRFALLSNLDKNDEKNYDPLLIMGFIDEVIEQIFARYSMLYQTTLVKKVEFDRDRLAKKLELNQQQLKTILYKSDTAIAVIDCSENFISWNRGAEIIFGYSEEEVIGQSSTFLLPNDEKYLKELEYIIEETKEKGSVHIRDTERKAKNGEIIPVQLKVTQMQMADGNNCGRTMIMHDKSQVKELQQQISQSEKLAVIGQLAAGVAHEIGNPLTSISALVQLIQRKSEDEKLNERLVIIRDNIDRISRIVRELVDFSRPSNADKELLNINDVLKTAVGIVKYDKRVKSVDFVTEFSHDLPSIYAAPDQLLQVYVNILINALDAIRGEGKIDVKTYLDDMYICADIKDDGIGMKKEIVDKIFNPFFTTKDVGKGTGLGLSVSYGIIKKMHGKILVESTETVGTTFTVKVLS